MIVNPLVSIVMPAYNSGSYIGASIRSVLNQTYENWELIILNDGSTDNTVSVVEAFQDPRIRLEHNPENLGLAKTRNKLFSFASGKYISILDSDDLALPDRILKQVAFLEKNPHFGLVGSWISFIDSKGKSLRKVMKYTSKPEHIPSILFIDNYFSQSTITVRKDIISNLQYRLEYPPCEDYDLWIRISRIALVYNLPEILVQYRVHDSNISKVQADKREDSERRILQDQLRFIGMDYTTDQLDFFYYNLKLGKGQLSRVFNGLKWTSELIKIVSQKQDLSLGYLPTYLRVKYLKFFVKSLITKTIPKNWN